ncbi:MAG: hypothetical protein E5Y38_14755 [Mesorhizobium sp.]|nr:MAG: hypothetical protein E5Y38_14755 [Mesorhizobium sp.]
MWQRDEALGPDLHEDLATALEFITEFGDTRSLAVLDDPDRAGELQELLFRIKGRTTLLGQSFERLKVNDRLRKSEHLVLMHQQM